MIRELSANAPVPEIRVEEVTDPIEIANAQVQFARFDRNVSWMEAHAQEVYSHRGKVVCIAGQELFVGDDLKEVVARANAAHPDDDGYFTRIIPLEKALRIYAHRR